MSIHLVQYNPELPQNTGNIMRTCAATGLKLHLIKPLGYHLDDKNIKRSGANYINHVEYVIYKNWKEFTEKNKEGNFYFCTSQGQKNYAEIDFSNSEAEHFIILGSENKEIPEEVIQPYLENCFHVPVVDQTRLLNISNLGAVVAYEALRQQDFLDLWQVKPFKGVDWILRDK